MKFLKSKNGMIAAGVVVILLLISGYLIFGGRSAEEDSDSTAEKSSNIQNVSPDQLGLSIEANSAGNEVRFALTKLEKIESIEYQIQYEADSTAREIGEGAEPRVDRGIIGEVETEPGDTGYESEWIVLGSESAGTKRYDTGVEEVSITLKLTGADGTIYQTEDSLEM